MSDLGDYFSTAARAGADMQQRIESFENKFLSSQNLPAPDALSSYIQEVGKLNKYLGEQLESGKKAKYSGTDALEAAFRTLEKQLMDGKCKPDSTEIRPDETSTIKALGELRDIQQVLGGFIEGIDARLDQQQTDLAKTRERAGSKKAVLK